MLYKYLYHLSFLAFMFLSVHVYAKDTISGQGILAVAKITGACGILDEMIHFQKTTKMPGGDAFVARFWTAEAARLGLTMKEYSDRCNKAINSYNTLWKAMEEKKK